MGETGQGGERCLAQATLLHTGSQNTVLYLQSLPGWGLCCPRALPVPGFIIIVPKAQMVPENILETQETGWQVSPCLSQLPGVRSG